MALSFVVLLFRLIRLINKDFLIAGPELLSS